MTSSPRNVRRDRLRDEGRIGQQSVGQRFETGFAGDLRLGPPLRLVRQVDVLDPRLGVGGQQRGPQLVGELALLLDGGQHRGPALVEFAQVAEALLEGAELPVVEAAGDLLAVARDERHGRALVEQPDGGGHLRLGYREFLSETGIYGLDGWARRSREDPTERVLTRLERRAWRVEGAAGFRDVDPALTRAAAAAGEEASQRRPPVGTAQPVLGHQHQRHARHADQRPGGDGPGAGGGRAVRPTTAADDARAARAV